MATGTIPDCLGAPPPTAPRRPLPRGACDTHLHVLGPYSRYPLAPERAYTVPEAPLSALRDYMRVTGVDRVVVAHVSAAGKDLAVTLDAIAELGDAARGTVMLEPEMDDARIRALDRLGMRGARLSRAFGDALTAETIRHIAARIAPYGWHIAIWPAQPEELELFAAVAGDLPVPLVLDHLASHCWTMEDGVDQPAFVRLRRLLGTGKVWLKLSGMYRASATGYPWAGLQPFMSTLVSEAPDQLIWASDWPHVGMPSGPMPLSGQMLDWLVDIGCDDAALHRILVQTPEKLFGFPPLSA